MRTTFVRGTVQPKESRTEWRRELALFLATLVPRVALFLLMRPWEASVRNEVLLTGDALGYHSRALTVFGALGFYPPDVSIDPYRPPLYPLFLASIYHLAGSHEWLALLAQSLLAGFTCVLLLRTVRENMRVRACWITGLAFALDPFLILHANLLLSETLFLFLCVLGLYSLRGPLTTGLDSRQSWKVAAAGVCFGLATLTRPVAALVPLAIVPLFFLLSRRPIRLPIVAGLLFVTAFLAAISPWVIRNRVVYGVAGISVITEYSVLFHKMVAPVEAAKTHRSPAEMETRLIAEAEQLMRAEGSNPDSLNPFQKAPYWRRLTLEYVRSDPLAYGHQFSRRLVFFLAGLGTNAYAQVLRLRGSGRSVDLDGRQSFVRLGRDLLEAGSAGKLWIAAWVALWLAATTACLLVGIVISWRNGFRPVGIACLILSAFFVVVGAAGGEPRYRLAALVFYLPFVGIGADWLLARRWRRIGRSPDPADPLSPAGNSP